MSMSKITRLSLSLAFIGGMILGPLFVGNASAGTVPGDGPCSEVKPLGFMDLLNLVDQLDQASSSGATVTTNVSPASIQEGAAISAAEKVEIENTLASLISCVNKRDPLRVVSLLSERYQSLLVLDLLGGANALSVLAQQVPDIFDSPDASDPLQTPDIVKAWHQAGGSDDIAAIVSMPIPGQTEDVSFYVVFTPVGDAWKIDQLARYED
jgi:hypothetical protein